MLEFEIKAKPLFIKYLTCYILRVSICRLEESKKPRIF